MIRTQIQLTEEQARRLRHEARRSGLSVAEIIRRSVDQHLERPATSPAPAVSRLSALDVVGSFHSGKSDVAQRHDDYLEESYLERGRPASRGLEDGRPTNSHPMDIRAENGDRP